MARSSGSGPGVAAGNPIQRPGTPSVDLTGDLDQQDYMYEAGNSGLKIFGGYVVEEFDPSLRGLRGARMFREMSDSSPTIGAFLYLINQVIKKLNWHVKPKDQTPLSLLAAEFLESVMEDMDPDYDWDSVVEDALSMVVFGYAPLEIVLKMRSGEQTDKRFSSCYDDGMVGIRKLTIRSQETILRWIMDPDNNDILGMVQMPWTGGIRMIPRSKFLLFRTRHFRNDPEGRSLLRNAYRPYYFAKRLEEIEGIGAERDLAGFPVIQIPAEVIAAGQSTPANPQAAATLTAYQNMVKNIKRNSQEGAVLPSDRDESGNLMFELKLLSSGGRRQFDTNVMIERYHAQAAMTVMADFLMLGRAGMGARGSGAGGAGLDKITMFYEAINGIVKSIVKPLNLQLIPMLCEMNGIPKENWPEFETDKPEQVDIGQLGAFVNALAASGMTLFPNEDLEDYLLRAAGLPQPTEETRAKQQAMQQPPPEEGGQDQGQPGTGGGAGQSGPGAGNDPRKGAQGDFGQQGGGGGKPPPSKPGGPGGPPS